MKLAIAALALLASHQAFAGAANAELNCQAPNGLTIQGHIPGDFAEFDLTLGLNGRSARMYSVTNQRNGETEENAEITVVQSVEEGVWTVKSELKGKDAYGFLELYALPKTLKYRETQNGFRSEFRAKAGLYLADLGDDSIYTELKCSLVYEI